MTAVRQQVIDTLGPSSSVVVNEIDMAGDQVIIDLSDLNGAPSAAQFQADLVDEIGSEAKVELR